MLTKVRTFSSLLPVLAFACVLPLQGQMPAGAPPTSFTVQLDPAATAPVSGRVLVFAKMGSGDSSVDVEEFRPADVWVGAVEVHDLAPGAKVTVYGNGEAYPKPFAELPAGTYEAQAVLDPDHTYNYAGRDPSDWISKVSPVQRSAEGASSATLVLDSHPQPDAKRAALLARIAPEVRPGAIELQEVESTSLTAFWGRPQAVRAYVVLPPGYAEHPEAHYPTAYWTGGFGSTLTSGLIAGADVRKRMESGAMPPMIWVMLDESCPQGTHEFADSVNNGPWGKALTTEFIPALERRYRMDARPAGRFLNGHSSGGWATLQLEINYPEVFGGTWSTSPDSSDFHNFTGPDLYAAHANVYRKPDGGAYPIMRVDGKVISTIQQFAQLEQVTGPYGGQFTSFDWVFSPRSDSGAPEPMFDRATGAVNPRVVAYWGEHYDLANIVERTWPARSAMLRGRIHLFVGTADTFYLDGAAHLLEARLLKLGADPHFTYLPGRNHGNVYVVGQDSRGLLNQIGAEMYAVARPGESWKH